MITLPSRTAAAGLNAAYSSQCTTLSLIGDRKVDVARGVSTGFASRGFVNGPSIQSPPCARAGDGSARPIRSTIAETLVTIRHSDRRCEAPEGGAITMADRWNSDRRCEAPEGGAIDGRLVMHVY